MTTQNWHRRQVDIQLLSWDGSSDVETLAMNAASAALLCSDVPWNGPVASVRVAWTGNSVLAHPSHQELREAPAQLQYVPRNALGLVSRIMMFACSAMT